MLMYMLINGNMMSYAYFTRRLVCRYASSGKVDLSHVSHAGVVEPLPFLLHCGESCGREKTSVLEFCQYLPERVIVRRAIYLRGLFV
jgi:hypothetical protein